MRSRQGEGRGCGRGKGRKETKHSAAVAAHPSPSPPAGKRGRGEGTRGTTRLALPWIFISADSALGFRTSRGFFRGLRTASSQERLALLASQIPSRKNNPPSLASLSPSNSIPLLLFLFPSSTVPQARSRSHRRRNHLSSPFSYSLSLSLLLGGLEGGGTVSSTRRDKERRGWKKIATPS